VANSSAEDIPPGGEGEVQVKFSSGKYDGQITKHVMVSTNDPSHKKIELTVTAHVQIDFKFNPDGIMFRNLRRYAGLTREIRIEGAKRDQIHIVKIKSGNPHVSATVQSVKEGNKDVPVISVKIEPGIPLGKLSTTLTVYTDSSKYPQMPIRVYGEIIGNISVSPEKVDFGFFEKDAPPVKKINISMEKPDEKFSILGIEDTTGMLGHDLATIAEGSKYQLSVYLLPGFDKKMITTSFFVLTNYPGEEKIKVNVLGGIKAETPVP
jgi:hypothetical protein